jgi:malate/lactate dehydrogenase
MTGIKLGIIGGAGLLGATTAFCAASQGLADEIVLYDVRENLAQSHAMDIEQAVCDLSGTRLSAVSLDGLKQCDIIVNVAGIPEISASSRDAYLSGNILIFRELAETIRNWGTSPVIISASNPIDVLNYSLYRMTGLPRERFIGFSRNDTLRFIWAASKETGIPSQRLDALVIGEHGDMQVPLFSRLTDNDSGQALFADESQKAAILHRVKSWFGDYQKLNAGRSSGWTSGMGICYLIKLIISGSGEICPCSVIPEGEYGLSNLSIGLPVRLGRSGVTEIVNIDLSGDEHEQLLIAAKKVKAACQSTILSSQ